jgi:succinate-semialdehyde dehydrogenase
MPTVLSGVTQGKPAFDEETFGPVAAITRVADVDATNASQFGLSGNIWTRDVALARKVAHDLYWGRLHQRCDGVGPSRAGRRRQEQWVWRELSHFGPHTFVNAQLSGSRTPERTFAAQSVSKAVSVSTRRTTRIEA